MGKQVLDYGKTITNAQTLCYLNLQDDLHRCHGAGDDPKQCTATANESYSQCFYVVSPTTKGRLEEYSIYAVIAFLAGYGVLFVIRTLGWVAAGFGRIASDRR
jgi:hypothetical protein